MVCEETKAGATATYLSDLHPCWIHAASRLPVRKGGLRKAPATQRALHAQNGRTGEIENLVGRHASPLEAAVGRVVMTFPRPLHMDTWAIATAASVWH